MKKFKMFICALLIVPFMLVGCGEKVDEVKTASISEQITAFSNVLNKESYNFTATVTSAGLTPEKGTGVTLNNAIKIEYESANKIHLGASVGEDNDYYLINNTQYTLDEDGWAIDYDQEVSISQIITSVIGEVPAISKDLLTTLHNLNENFIQINTLESGAMELVIDLNLTQSVKDFVSIVKQNYTPAVLGEDGETVVTAGIDNSVITLINALLNRYVKEGLTLNSLIDNIDSKLDANSTITDLLNVIGTEYGITLTNTVKSVMTIIEMISEGEVSSELLNTKVYSLIEGIINEDAEEGDETTIDKTTFKTTIQGFIDGIFNSVPAVDKDGNPILDADGNPTTRAMKTSELFAMIQAMTADTDKDPTDTGTDVYAVLTNSTFNEISATIKITTSTDKLHLAGVTVNAVADMVLLKDAKTAVIDKAFFDDGNSKYTASAAVEISKIGTTTVTLPTFTEDTVIDDIDVDLLINLDTISTETYLIASNLYLGANNFNATCVIYVSGVPTTTYTVSYDTASKTLKIDAATLTYLKALAAEDSTTYLSFTYSESSPYDAYYRICINFEQEAVVEPAA